MLEGSKNEPIEFRLFDFKGTEGDSQFNLLMICTVMGVLLIVLISSLLQKFKLSVMFAKTLFAVYFLTLAVSFGGFFYINKNASQ